MTDKKTTHEKQGAVGVQVEPIVMCGCGRMLRYSHLKDGNEVMSCNKYTVCLTYSELNAEAIKYKAALERIVNVKAMNYEYKAWAKGALNT
jgi:hypothetical protein